MMALKNKRHTVLGAVAKRGFSTHGTTHQSLDGNPMSGLSTP
jgi:hypothetical protein